MRDEGAVVNVEDVPANIRRSSPTNEDWVFTDSNFFFDHTISEKLIEFYRRNAPITDELCAYGDFLQPLGARAADVYINNCQNIISISENTLSTRRKVFELLRGSPLKIIALKQSKFYHIGTMAEYLESFCDRYDLREELGLSTFCFSAVIGASVSTQPSLGGCVMHSLVNPNCSFSDRSVVEFCQFMGPVKVQSDSVISNCVYASSEHVSIPPNTFLQTVPVHDADSTKYVTLAFSVRDDMKAKADSLTDTKAISYFERSLSDICHVLNVCPADIFSRDAPITLWHAKLFPLSETPQQSFICALDIIKRLISPVKRRPAASKDIYFTSDASAESVQCYNDPIPSINGSNATKCNSNCSQNTVSSPQAATASRLLYSFADVVKRKDANLMIQQRNELANKIRYAM